MRFLTLAAICGLVGTAGASYAASPTVIVAPIRGAIDPATSSYLRGAIARAESVGAEALLVELDTPGGLISSVREMAQSIDHSRIPVITYVTPAGAAATSAGALLMLSAHLAAMAPGTNIGAAHPVSGSGQDIPGVMGQKILNDTLAFARGLAELRGRPRDLAEAVVAKSRSLTANEALSLKLIDATAVTPEELLEKLDGATVHVQGGSRTLHLAQATTEEIPMTLGQRLLHLLANPNLAAILMSLGILLIYLEASHPGGIAPGILGGICLLVAFMALQTLPIRDGAAALVILGIALMIAEPFVTSHGAAAAGGVLSFLLGLLWLVDPSATDVRLDRSVWAGVSIGLAALVALITYAAAHTHTLARLARARTGGGALLGLQGYMGEVASVLPGGLQGTARFRGEVWEFESDTALEVGTLVHAVAIEGMRIRVRKAGPGG